MSQVLPLPPPDLIGLVGADNGDHYDEIGRQWADVVKRVGGLRPEHRLLDIGCGCGRLAAQLTVFLTNGYEGLDVYQPHVEWCQRHISPRFPRFHFTALDVQNSHYNPHGKIAATNVRLPYDDSSFDFVCALSLFTHMLSDCYKGYLREIRRVLRPGGTLFATYFLLTPDSWRLMKTEHTNLRLTEPVGPCLVQEATDPEAAVGYPEDYIILAHRRAGLEIETLLEGSWCGRRRRIAFQDIVIAPAVAPSEQPLFHSDPVIVD